MPAGPRLFSYRFAQKPNIFLPVGRKKKTDAQYPVAASLGPAGMKPNGVELVENGLDLKASCPG